MKTKTQKVKCDECGSLVDKKETRCITCDMVADLSCFGHCNKYDKLCSKASSTLDKANNLLYSIAHSKSEKDYNHVKVKMPAFLNEAIEANRNWNAVRMKK